MSQEEEPTEEKLLFKRLKDCFADAEAMEAKNSLVYKELDVVVINQLRYAGFHILAAYKDDGAWDSEQLKKAITHCERAHCDAMYSVTEYLINSCEDFVKTYRGKREIVDIIHNYNDLLKDMDEASGILSDFITHLKDGERDEEIDHYNLKLREELIPKMVPFVNKLSEILKIFNEASPKIDAVGERLERKATGGKIFAVILVIAAAFFASFFTWLFSKGKARRPCPPTITEPVTPSHKGNP